MTEGRKYKNIKEREFITEKIYKYTKQILDSIQNDNQTSSYIKPIDTKDIFYTIKLDSPFINESTEEKRKIKDKKNNKIIKKQLSERLTE